jgi:endonuclease YncB( thermonuclease family)
MGRRRDRRILSLAVLLVAGFEARPRGVPQGAERLHGVVTRVADGDTIDITSGGVVHTVRLDAIDAPEVGQPFSRQARLQLRTLAFGRNVTARVVERDRYGRLVARATVGLADLSEEMVRHGLAWHYSRYSPDRHLAELEQQARRQRRGLWADPNPVAPWLHRTESPRAPPRPPAARPRSAPSLPGPYHGNVSSRVYHAPGCRDYDCRRCTEAFMSRAAAEAAGYRPHGLCVNRR